MAVTYFRGIDVPYTPVNAGVVPVDVFGIAINFFMDRTPLVSRLPKRPEGSLSFKITKDQFRPNTTTMNQGATLASGGTSLTVTDASYLLVGDTIEIEDEMILITAISTNTLTITRGYGGTTAASHVDAQTVYLVGRTTTGGEVDTDGIQLTVDTVDQYMQTIQHTYQVAGAVQSARNYALPPGLATPLARHKMIAMQHAMDDMERACFYGRGVALAATTTKQQMKGLRSLCTTNNVTNATNKTAYKPSDFYRDTIYRSVAAGGNPEVFLCSPDWGVGFLQWGWPLQMVDPGNDAFGTRFRAFRAPFAEDILIFPDPNLRSGTGVTLSKGEARLAVKRALSDKPRGSRGDADEGDMIAEVAIELDNEQHHCWLSGITGFAVQS